jgi:hypothetical protein
MRRQRSAAGHIIVHRIALLGRQPARDLAHDRNYLLHDITAVSSGGTFSANIPPRGARLASLQPSGA